MTKDIHFTSFGVPYILEFDNVSFVPHQRRCDSPASSTSSSSSFCYIDSPPSPPRRPSFSLLSPSSVFKRKHNSTPTYTQNDPPIWCANSESTKPLPPPPQSDAAETNGIYIRSPLECNHPQTTRKDRLARLQHTISVAVLDAGMSRSPGNMPHPEKHSSENRGYRTPDALFCGTYGQMMAALEGAGLSATPCAGEDLPGHTRLGALFVARNDGASGVQLRKITLWG